MESWQEALEMTIVTMAVVVACQHGIMEAATNFQNLNPMGVMGSRV